MGKPRCSRIARTPRAPFTYAFVATVKEQLEDLDDADINEVTIDLRHLWVFPFADTLLLTDALVNGDVGPDYIVLRLEFNEANLSPRIYGQPMASMQSPSILDWRLSPSSFSLASPLLVSQDGCETLLPANLSTQLVRFRQVLRLTKPPQENQQNDLDEKTKLSERLTHEQRRNRSLSETVHGVLTELQEGSNFQAGAALSVAGGANLGVFSLGAGMAGAIGGGSSESSGTRTVQAETMQQIADAFHQSSSAIRELESTVVMQVDQAESSNVQTRTVANYNHGHALTLLYYEVLRHL